jgi:DNA primase
MYKNWYAQGLEPTAKNFLYHEDQELSALAVSIMDLNAQNELSPNWKEHYEGKIFLPDELYRETVLSTVRYLKLRKIHRLIEENQNDMKTPHSEEELKIQMQTARHLKDMEKELMRDLGTVATKYV